MPSFTADGVHKVVALDLVARHVILTQLAGAGLLSPECRVLSILAASQAYPRMLVDAASVQQHLEAACVSLPPATASLAGGFSTMFHTALAHDAWLRHVATRHPGLTKSVSAF